MLGDVDRVCPLLALAADRRTVMDGVDASHRCHALPEPLSLERQLQAQVCLTPTYDRCERYLQHVARRGASPGRSAIADGFVSTRMLLAPEPAWRGIAGRARRTRSARAMAIGGGVIAVGVAGAALAGPIVSGGISLLDASTAPPATASPIPTVASPRPSASPTPTAMPSPSVTPSPQPDVSPPASTPAPTAEPPPPPVVRTYVVQAGDTLAEIAQEFGTTVAALQQTNGIEDPNEIIIGQVLVIP
jgi:LysM repeat protein